MQAGDAVARLVREEGTRVLATLIRVTGSVELAGDAAQDAVVRAPETWPRDGVPDNPRAWLLVTARRRALDVIRREARRAGKEAAAMIFTDPAAEPAGVVRDDCSGWSSPAVIRAWPWRRRQVALALRALGGGCPRRRSPAP